MQKHARPHIHQVIELENDSERHTYPSNLFQNTWNI